MSVTFVRVINKQVLARSILIDKIDRSQGKFTGYAQKKKQRVYVPYSNPVDSNVKGYSDFVPTDEVLLSANNGTIKGLQDGGYIDVALVSSSLVGAPTVSGSVWNVTDLTVSGTIFQSVDPDLTYVTLTNTLGVSQTISQSVFLGPSLATVITLANELKLDYNAHRTQAGVHSADDLTNVVASPNATDLATLITLLNELKSDYNAHRTQVGVHPANDTVNIVTSPDAVDLASAAILAAELKLDYNAHRVQAGVHSSDDLTNVVSSSITTGSISATTIVIPSAYITGTPGVGWKVKVMANSKTSNTFTM